MPVDCIVEEILEGSVKKVLFGSTRHPEEIGTPQGGKFPVSEVGKAQGLLTRRIGHREKPVEIINSMFVTGKAAARPEVPERVKVGGKAAFRPLSPGIRCRTVPPEEVCESRQVRVEEGTPDSGTIPQKTGNLCNAGGRFTGFGDGRMDEQYHPGTPDAKS
jgi:hypothetical protein